MKNQRFYWLTLALALTTTVGWGATTGANDANLWPPGRITAAEQALDKLKVVGLMSRRFHAAAVFRHVDGTDDERARRLRPRR